MFDQLEHRPYRAREQDLVALWERTVKNSFTFPDFVLELERIGLTNNERERDGTFRFAFLYAAGFRMNGYAGYQAK